MTGAMAEAPEGALAALADLLREEGSVISPHVTDPTAPAALGVLAAAGPRAAEAPADYALVVEAVREGYLLHYGEPRILAEADSDLALLAGDYLYATGLARLAQLGDLDAVRELSDLISLSAHIHGGGKGATADSGLAAALWLAAASAVGGGPSEGYEAAKTAARNGDSNAEELLVAAAEAAGSEYAMGEAREAIGFPTSSTNLS